jgi:hypothetical protein
MLAGPFAEYSATHLHNGAVGVSAFHSKPLTRSPPLGSTLWVKVDFDPVRGCHNALAEAHGIGLNPTRHHRPSGLHHCCTRLPILAPRAAADQRCHTVKDLGFHGVLANGATRDGYKKMPRPL